MILNLLYIQIIICFIIDCSGVIQSMEKGLSRLLKYRVAIPRPWSCALCSGFWINLLYLIFTGHFTIHLILATSILAFLSKTISGILIWIQEFFIHLLDILYRWIR